MIIDFHSHILPGIDDGARNIEESVALLDHMAESGTETVIATPHFYFEDQSVEDFIENRNAAYEKLKPYLKPEHPEIILGAEVLYNPLLSGNDILYKLKIQNTDYLLLEMPYTELTADIIQSIDNIVNFMDLRLVIAHIERYLNYTSFKSLCSLMDLDVSGQINVRSLIARSTKKSCFKLIKRNYVHVLGSDLHRTSDPVPMISDAFAIIDKKFGKGYTESLMDNAECIINNEDF
ncbi:MAG: CpsB/CapC family capsule biosynthesis tyrosine phosphatase [Oscillospiraceae bacterium]